MLQVDMQQAINVQYDINLSTFTIFNFIIYCSIIYMQRWEVRNASYCIISTMMSFCQNGTIN